MSVVVAITEQSRVYLGSDSIAVDESGYIHHNKQKTWYSPSNDRILIGATGDLTVIEQVRHKYGFATDTPTQENVNEWIHNLAKMFPDNNDYSFIIAGNGKIFIADGAGLVLEQNNFACIGSGRDAANGVLYAINQQSLPPESKIHTAIDAAKQYNIYVGGEVDIKFV